MTDETTTTTATSAPSEGERSAPPERPAAKRVAPVRKPRPKIVGVPNDGVADLLTRVRNAAGARHDTVSMPTSRTKVEIAKILKSEGFISSFEQPSARELLIKMKYIGGKVPAVSGLKRISKPGLRVYARALEISGTGYRAIIASKKLQLSLGFSHPVEIDPPAGVTFSAETPQKLKVSGVDKEAVGEMAAKIRSLRVPDPYKHKGIKYV